MNWNNKMDEKNVDVNKNIDPNMYRKQNMFVHIILSLRKYILK